MRHLESEAVLGGPEDKLIGLWTEMNRLVWLLRSYSDNEWAPSTNSLSRISATLEKLAPSNPIFRHRITFQLDDPSEFLETDNSEEDKRRSLKKREQAVLEILSFGGMDAVVKLVNDADASYNIAEALASVATSEIDDYILPSQLETESSKIGDFVRYYVFRRRHQEGWEWFDGLDRTNWSTSQTARILSFQPFEADTWHRVTEWLGDNEDKYWLSEELNILRVDADIEFGIDKLIQFRRYGAAIKLLVPIGSNQPRLDIRKGVEVLNAVSAAPGSVDTPGSRYIVMLIKALQSDSATEPQDLAAIEWAYFPLLDSRQGIHSNNIERYISERPDAFCELIRLIYRSSKAEESIQETTERIQILATNAWSLLRKWRTTPGKQSDGSFSADQFNTWLSHVKESCEESGHLEVAFTHIGQVLVFCPPDPDGLWMHHAAAEALNDEETAEMRTGYYLGLRNSRGTYFVDPTGAPELGLAYDYRTKADEIEDARYQRIARALRDLADSYESEAQRNIDLHHENGEL